MYQDLTLNDLRVRLAAKRDQILQWTPEEERRAINEALRFWNLLTGRWRRRISLTTSSGTVEYTLPSTMIYGMRVTVSNAPLVCTSILELDLLRPTWRNETIASGGSVPTVPTCWAPLSLQRIAIWPAVTSTIVDGLQVDGVSATPVLIEDADTVDLGQDLLDLLLNFVLHLLAFKTGGPVWQATLPFYRAFLIAAAEENGVLKTNQAFRRASGLNRRGQLQPSKGATTELDPIAASVGGGT